MHGARPPLPSSILAVLPSSSLSASAPDDRPEEWVRTVLPLWFDNQSPRVLGFGFPVGFYWVWGLGLGFGLGLGLGFSMVFRRGPVFERVPTLFSGLSKGHHPTRGPGQRVSKTFAGRVGSGQEV